MKKYLLGIFAVVLAVSMSAFSIKSDTKKSFDDQESYWFFEDTSGEQALYTNYTNVPQSNCDTEGSLRCEILAFPNSLDNTKPDLNRAITEISYKP